MGKVCKSDMTHLIAEVSLPAGSRRGAMDLLMASVIRNRKFDDSLLEGGVYCELVSEVGLRRLANKARFQGVYG